MSRNLSFCSNHQMHVPANFPMKIRVLDYKSPDSSRDVSPLPTNSHRRKHFTSSVSWTTNADSDDRLRDLQLSELATERYRMQSKITKLTTRLSERDSELIVLRAGNEALERAAHTLQQELRAKETEIARLRVKLVPHELEQAPDYSQLMQELDQLESHYQQLSEENTILKQRHPPALSRDIAKIKRQVKELRILVDTIKRGEQISLKLMLGSEIAGHAPSERLSFELQLIKGDLQHIRMTIADYQAEQCGGPTCLQQ